jgi:hypothetical protein
MMTHRVGNHEPKHRPDERVRERQEEQIAMPLVRPRRRRAADQRHSHQERIRHVRRGEHHTRQRSNEKLVSRVERRLQPIREVAIQ